ncbi:hypothetical protein [Cognatishimia sp. MH4019]|uniref:hypothetical protein n=1 Tax=Cognatishimia sp. MH4019 TaxID=2854030 RepID=UPI001CD6914D|nr:hypothetical protein [Cognatishimia sp. MH4019]
MSDLAEYERRISAALEKIGAGVEALSKPSAAPETSGLEAELAGLRAQLEDEKTANAQLEERIRTLKDRQDGEVAGQSEALAAQAEKISKIDKELHHLRQVNGQLRDAVAKLREANAEGLAEPHLINKAMLTELEALRAVQAADAAEVDVILDELAPLMKEGA